MCTLVFVVYSTVLTTILRVGHEGELRLLEVIPPEPRESTPHRITPPIPPRTILAQKTPPPPDRNFKPSLDYRLNTDWENPWDGARVRIERGVGKLYPDTIKHPRGGAHWLSFAEREPGIFLVGGGGPAASTDAWLFGEDMLEIHVSPDYFGLWWPRRREKPAPEASAIAGTWNGEFFHATFRESVELTLRTSETFPVAGQLRIRSEMGNWTAPLSVTAADDSNLMMKLRRTATGSSAIRSERYLLKLSRNYGCGLGSRGGCLRLNRIDRLAVSSNEPDSAAKAPDSRPVQANCHAPVRRQIVAADLTIDAHLNTVWVTPWENDKLRIEGGVGTFNGVQRFGFRELEPQLFYTTDADQNSEQAQARLFSEDLLELDYRHQSYAFWRHDGGQQTTMDSESFAGRWTCEFLHESYHESFELDLPEVATLPVTATLRSQSEQDNWSAPVLLTLGAERDLLLNLRRAGIASNAVRSEVYRLKLTPDHGCGVGRWGGCLRLSRVERLDTTSE
jgi:hypothetical protein